ncbi:SseB family protein [Herbidospora sp. RD11066]
MPSIPQPMVPDDDGRADAALAQVLAAFQTGETTIADVLTALGPARLLVPVVALLTEAEIGDDGLKREKESEMALPKLVGQDGRMAVLAFTSVEALARWRADARPIQASASQVCKAALHEQAAAVVIDVAGPAPFAVEGSMLHAMAAIEDAAALKNLDVDVPGVTVARFEAPAPKKKSWWRR